MSGLDLGIVALGFEGRVLRPAPATHSAATRFTICWYTSETMTWSVNGTECGAHGRCTADS